MPNFDMGAYFLTVLCPVSTTTLPDDKAAKGVAPARTGTSPVHALREQLARLAPAQQTPESVDDKAKSPFVYHTRVHFARFVVIDDAMYVGRKTNDAILSQLIAILPFVSPSIKKKFDPIIPQPEDRLPNPYLFFSMDFDAPDGSDESRDSLLRELWSGHESGKLLKNIFHYCEEFPQRVRDDDPQAFAKYIADCQVETTMPFHDYFMDNVPVSKLPSPAKNILIAAVAAIVGTFAVLQWLVLPEFLGCLRYLISIPLALAVGVFLGVRLTVAAGQKPFPPAPSSTLPEVLKSLHVKNAFTRFVIDNQARSIDPADAQTLYDRFGAFLEAEKPLDLNGPTQEPGVIGF